MWPKSDRYRAIKMDVNYTEGDRLIELNAPEELYEIANLWCEPERYVIESIWSRSNGKQAVKRRLTKILMDKSDFLYPRYPYRGQWTPDYQVTLSRNNHKINQLFKFLYL